MGAGAPFRRVLAAPRAVVQQILEVLSRHLVSVSLVVTIWWLHDYLLSATVSSCGDCLTVYWAVLVALALFYWHIFCFAKMSLDGFYKFFLMSRCDLLTRYGANSWAVVTGADCGQGRLYALGLANRGFNVVLMGYDRCDAVRAEIQKACPNVQVKVVVADFSCAHEQDFFGKIGQELSGLDISLLINNVGHRVAWAPYHEMPAQKINDTITVGTIVQARLTHLVLPHMVARLQNKGKKSGIVNITAQCQMPTYLLGMMSETSVSVPYLSCYEAANAFGYYHSNSIHEEYKHQIDVLNITPGAVITENTQCLVGTSFAIGVEQYVENVFGLMGRVTGISCGHWGHALSSSLGNLAPFVKAPIIRKAGQNIADAYMKAYHAHKLACPQSSLKNVGDIVPAQAQENEILISKKMGDQPAPHKASRVSIPELTGRHSSRDVRGRRSNNSSPKSADSLGKCFNLFSISK